MNHIVQPLRCWLHVHCLPSTLRLSQRLLPVLPLLKRGILGRQGLVWSGQIAPKHTSSPALLQHSTQVYQRSRMLRLVLGSSCLHLHPQYIASRDIRIVELEDSISIARWRRSLMFQNVLRVSQFLPARRRTRQPLDCRWVRALPRPKGLGGRREKDRSVIADEAPLKDKASAL